VGRRLRLERERLELSLFSRGPKDEISRTDAKKPERRQYLENAYHVLLRRARHGIVIFVPPWAKQSFHAQVFADLLPMNATACPCPQLGTRGL
jgi:hypothetical protein